MARLGRGDLLPRIKTPPPGPAARRLAARLAKTEAPRVNTVGPGGAAIAWSEACGANVLDVDGNRYIDLTAGFGVAAVGHRHPAVTAAIERQSGLLVHGLADVAPHPARAELAARLAARAPVDDARVYFAVSGSDAVEIAVKNVLLATGKPGIVAFAPAYHGLTLGALAVTSRDELRRPFAAHLHRHVHRLPHGCAPEDLAALARLRGDLGGVLLEPIVGREGVIVPPAGWLAAIATVCRRAGLLLVVDEILTGFGRTGRWFAVEHEGVRPDLLCCGKALGGGLPIAAVIGRADVVAAWERPGEALHSATFLAHPLAIAASLAVLDLLASEKLPRRAAQLGRFVDELLGEHVAPLAAVVEVRGRGLLWGVETVSAQRAAAAVEAAAKRGVLLLAGGPGANVLELTPPLIITRPQLERAIAVLAEALASPVSPQR